ncbi:MAG: methionyl-tRNA formyltransferase [Patescibacteria group bacterium]
MIKDCKFAFFGTAEFAVIILEKLIKAGRQPEVVVCNPDKPVGRKKVINIPLTKLLAQKYGIKVYQPEKLGVGNSAPEAGNADFAIVAAYGQIIPRDILGLFPDGVIGVHPSLLPKYRGSSPVQTVILNGENETGVTLFLMDEKIDHGKILASGKSQMANGETYQSLLKKLAETAADLMIETLPKLLDGEIKPISQDENLASYTGKFITEDGFVDLEKDNPAVIERKIRALNPEPGVYTFMPASGLADKKKRVKLLEAVLKDGQLFITKIQVEGQKPRTAKIRI